MHGYSTFKMELFFNEVLFFHSGMQCFVLLLHQCHAGIQRINRHGLIVVI